jgi:hypothetical protein
MLLVPLCFAATASAQDTASSLNPDLSFILDVAGAVFTAEEPLPAGGHDPTATGLTLQGLELAASKAVDPYFEFDANLVFSLEGVEIEEAYATTLALPGRFQVRAGRFLTRFGRANPTHLHTWSFVDQAFPVTRVLGAEGSGGIGAEASWLAPLPWSLEIAASGTAAGAAHDHGEEEAEEHEPLFHPLATVVVEQFFSLGEGTSLLWGLSGTVGPDPASGEDEARIAGTDLTLLWRPLSGGRIARVRLETEWFWRERTVGRHAWTDLSGTTQVTWRFARRWEVGGRHEFGSPAVPTDGGDRPDPTDPDWSADRHRGSAAFTFRPSEFSRIRLQGEADLAGWIDRPQYAGFLAFEVSAGAHGAHAF